MIIWFRLFTLTLLALMASPSIADAAGNDADGPYVTIKHAVSVLIGSDRKALSIDYEYRFPGQDKVHISGLGVVPAAGSFTYITEASSLVFSDEFHGKVLASVDLKETVAVAAKPPLNKVPADEEFDPTVRAFRWTSSESLQVRVGAVLRNYFSYKPREFGGVTEFATTFAPITATIGYPTEMKRGSLPERAFSICLR